MSEAGNLDNLSLGVWDPKRYLSSVDAEEARLSRGFLRCAPERWVPGFAAQWLPLLHSLGVEARVVEVTPRRTLPAGLEPIFAGTVDDDPVALFLERGGSAVVMDCCCPGLTALSQAARGGQQAQNVLLEYLGRRFLTSLGLAWTGPQPSVVQCDPLLRPIDVPAVGAVRFVVSLNGRTCGAWLALSGPLVDRLDGLWRRQLHASTRPQDIATDIVGFEVAQLAVAPARLADFTTSGALVDLELALSDTVILRQGSKPWLLARMCEVDGTFAFEVLPGTPPSPSLPEGTTRVSVQFGRHAVDAATAAEIAQPGAVLVSDIPVSDRVVLTVNNERVSDAVLCVYEGRFAIHIA